LLAKAAQADEAAPESEPVAVPAPPRPTPEEPERSPGRDRVVAYNSGFRWGLAPGIFIPASGGSVGFSLSAHAGYGFDTGSVIVIPGATALGLFPKDGTVLAFVPGARLVLPIGFFAPFIEAGAGPGHVTKPSGTGAALSAGTGFMVHPTDSFAIGAAGSYMKITGTDVSVLSVGPILSLSL
jgi:hypothetical protein